MRKLLFVLCAGSLLYAARAAPAQEPTGETRTGVTVLSPDGREVHAPEAPPPAETPAPARALPTPVSAPIGSVVAWLQSFPGTPPLPAGWAECNGQVLNAPASPYHGKQLPNLNGAGGEPQRFLRGSESSGAEGGSETHNHDPFLVQRTGDNRINVAERKPARHLPPYYEVTWIMRVE